MNTTSIKTLLRRLKAVFKHPINTEMKQIYSDFFKTHENSGTLMLHREDLYTSGAPRREFSSVMMDLVEKHAGKHILDIGCGVGVNCKELNRRGFQCVGIEAEESYIDEAKSNHSDIHLMRAENLEFPGKSFDTSLMLEVLEHLQDPGIVLPQILRITRKNLIVSVPNLSPLEICVQHNLVMHHLLETTHLNFFTKSMLERFLKKYFPFVKVGEFGQFFNLSGHKLFYHLYGIGSFDPIKGAR